MREKWSTLMVLKVLLLIVGCLVVLYPVAWMVSTAFTPNGDAFNQLIPRHVTFSNFKTLNSLRDSFPVVRWLINSLFAAACASVLVTLIDSLAAYALARLNFVGRRLIFYTVILSLVVPFVAILIPLYLEFSNLNLLDTYWALILPYSANAFGVFLLYQFYLGIPKDLHEAAIIDGASKFRTWLSIFFPLSAPATATLALLTFMNVYNDFFWPLVATTSAHMRTLTVGVQIISISNYSTNYSLLMATTVISIIPMVIAFLVAQRQLVQGVTMSGIK